MFTRASSGPGRDAFGPDPLHLRIATAAVVLGLIASGVAVVWGDLATRGGVLLPRAAMGLPDRAAAARRFAAAPVPAPGELSPARAASPGVRLLRDSAAADRQLSYQGVQVSAWHGPEGSVISVLQVWHQRGRQAVTQVTTAPAGPAGAQPGVGHIVADPEVGAGSGADLRASDGSMGLTMQLVALLATNYQVFLGGRAMMAGRPAEEVVLRRRDGVLAARFWLDIATKLPLRKQVFDSSARLVSEDTFLGLTLGRPAAGAAPAAGRMPASVPLSAARLARLRAAGWPLPGRLPGGLTLVQARQTGTAGAVVDLAYSDGLSVISLFLQRGHLPARLSGWSRVAVRGQQVLAADPDQRSVAWSARGYVFTLIADAPETTVDQVVGTLPHADPPGFVGRMRRGMARLASWLNPFR